jgi:hypothetical protein
MDASRCGGVNPARWDDCVDEPIPETVLIDVEVIPVDAMQVDD